MVGRYIPLQIGLGNHRLVGLRWCIGGSLPLQINLGDNRLVELRWYIGGSLTLQISLGNHWLVELCWYTLVGADPKVLGNILKKIKNRTRYVRRRGIFFSSRLRQMSNPTDNGCVSSSPTTDRRAGFHLASTASGLCSRKSSERATKHLRPTLCCCGLCLCCVLHS